MVFNCRSCLFELLTSVNRVKLVYLCKVLKSIPRACYLPNKFSETYFKQDKQCTYNVPSRRVRATIVAVERQWILHSLSVCICGLRYPAWNAHAPYYHLWPATLYNIFPRLLINGTIFEKKLLNTKCVFWFSLQLLSETFLILIRNKRDMINKNYIGLHVKYRCYSCPIWMKPKFSQQNLDKFLNIKFY